MELKLEWNYIPSRQILKMYYWNTVFKGQVCQQGEYKIHHQENAKPVVHPPRKLPFENRVKAELKRMEIINVMEGKIEKERYRATNRYN